MWSFSKLVAGWILVLVISFFLYGCDGGSNSYTTTGSNSNIVVAGEGVKGSVNTTATDGGPIKNADGEVCSTESLAEGSCP